jgi:hypothetical protein
MVLASISSLVQYIFVVAALQVSQVSTQAGPSHANSICLQIANAVSNNTNVYFPGTVSNLIIDLFLMLLSSGKPNYEHDIAHYAGSSTQESLCSVEPGNPTDVGKIVCYPLLDRISNLEYFLPSAETSGPNSDAIRSKKRWSHHEPRVFLHYGCSHIHDSLLRGHL